MMTPEIFIKRQLNACQVKQLEIIQFLWSGYGELARYLVRDELKTHQNVILKHIRLPNEVHHVRGWHSDFAHQRKVRSYQVEAAWYQNWSSRCGDSCRVAHSLGVYADERTGEQGILLEDLDASGFFKRFMSLTPEDCLPCLNWLAQFHALFIQEQASESVMSWPSGLWEVGTYWHLGTRQAEWQAMAEGELKSNASAISQKLLNARFKTLVHGDAKVANFCFSEDGKQVAAVDFQYVGAGIGVQDVAYFLGSALTEEALDRNLSYLLEDYFAELGQAIVARGESQDFASAVIEEWQSLFALAWADFHRFILGWSPDHKKNTAFSRAMVEQALAQLNH